MEEAKMDMDDAYEDWEAAGKSEIEGALRRLSDRCRQSRGRKAKFHNDDGRYGDQQRHVKGGWFHAAHTYGIYSGTQCEAVQSVFFRVDWHICGYAKDMRQIGKKFEAWFDCISNYMILLEESEREGWKALDVDENCVSELTGKPALLEDAIEKAQESILPDSFSKGGKIAKSYGTTRKRFYRGCWIPMTRARIPPRQFLSQKLPAGGQSQI